MKSDKIILDGIKNGNEDAIELLIAKYSGAMKHYGIIHFYKVDIDIIEDCITDTFLKLLRKIKDFQYINENKFKAWLFTTFKNLVVNEINKTKALKRGGDLNDSQIDENLDTIIVDQTENSIDTKMINQSYIMNLFEKLKTDEKTILWYHAKGYTNKEIADFLGITLSALKSKKHRTFCKARGMTINHEE